MITIADFIDDEPWHEDKPALSDVSIPDQIAGVHLQRIVTHGDDRGDLSVLLSSHYGDMEPIPHVYLVTAAPGSLRAWVFHRRQHDRLAYTQGDFRVGLYDLRPDSPTYGILNVIEVGAANKILLTIPPFVAHGVQNRGGGPASFVNMPTRAYDPSHPDKARLSARHPGVPACFD
ncbi:MAG: dTDP-4-dehydrorhamnose 3,5-epimerase family protein [Flavobacteriaceae bacterium]